MNQDVTLLAAFAAGFLSFVSPCVLPLIPGYISFVSGVSVDEMRTDTAPTTSRLACSSSAIRTSAGPSPVRTREDVDPTTSVNNTVTVSGRTPATA